ncbi:hypothetical protein JW872_01495 [Candidatus Babeliales bacterium]|nr:hypothetical protein [Candidatus Babeliales bacterium]
MKHYSIIVIMIFYTNVALCPIVVPTPMDRAYAALNSAKSSGTLSAFFSAIDTIEYELGNSVGNRNLTLLALDAAAQQSSLNKNEKAQIKNKVQDTMVIGQSETQRQLTIEVIEGIQGPIAEERNALILELETKKLQIDQLNQQTQQLVQARLYDEQGIKLLEDCTNQQGQ